MIEQLAAKRPSIVIWKTRSARPVAKRSV